MKKTQWQFTHRPDNLADIKRILREAREDGLTLVEVKGGPKELRGVYLDAQFIEKHKEHWPKTPLPGKLHARSNGWTGNYIMYAGEAKKAHEQFCKNLEAAQVKPREYPPTVSVRAAGPDLEPNWQLGLYASGVKAHEDALSYLQPKEQQWLPKPGEWFKVSGYRPEFSVFKGTSLQDADRKHDGRSFECISVDDPKACDVSHDTIRRYGNCIICKDSTNMTGERVFRTKEWAKIEPIPTPPPARYVPVPGDKFTAKGIHSGALSETRDHPHKDVFECLSAGEAVLTVRGSAPGDRYLAMTKRYYEFKKAEEQTPYIPQVGDKFTVAGKKGRERTTFTWAQTRPYEDVLECTAHIESMLYFKDSNGNKSLLTTDAYEFKKVEEQTPYIPQPGDKFTAKGIHEGALSETLDHPHKDVFECVDNIGTLYARLPHGGTVTMTKRYYEFKKVEEQTPYIPQVGDKFTAKGIHSGALSETIDQPHMDVFECLDTGVATLSARRPAYGGEDWTMTKHYYEFRKVPS